MSGEQKILVIDDEVSVGHLIRRILERKYPISVFQAPEPALQELEKEEFSLVFLDVKLHESDGFEVLQEIQRLYPDLKVVIMSGFIDPEIEARAEKEAYRFLQKPFAVPDVRKIADEVLADPL